MATNLPYPDDWEIQRSFLEFLNNHNLTPAENISIVLDSDIHRYALVGDKHGNKSGAYCVYTDKWPGGWAMDWHVGHSVNWVYPHDNFNDEQNTYFNSDEFKQDREEAIKKKEQERKAKQAEAAAHARNRIDTLPEADGNHKYFIAKRIYPYGVKIDGHNLAVPLRDINGLVQSLQWIYPDGHKNMFPGATTTGLFWSVALDTVDPKDNKAVILLGEGFATMAKCYELTGYPAVAALSCFQLRTVAELLHQKFPLARIIITADNDKATELKRDFNPGVDAARKTCRAGLAVDCIFPIFPKPDDGTDWDDYALFYGDDKAQSDIHALISKALTPKHIQDIQSRITCINAQDLRHKIFPPVNWAIPGFLPAGLSILAGGPKIGKSILALHLALGIAIGGCVLGSINVQKGSVLYLALEDTERRLQERINYSNILTDDDDLSKLTLITNIPRQHEGGLDYLDWWAKEHSDARLIIIDTFQMFRKLLSGKGSMYAEDYDAVSKIKSIGDNHNISVTMLHHLKKGMEGDWLSEISGSQGIAGAADTIFSLKRDRNSNMGTLHRTGRDVEEKDFMMKLDGFGWLLLGEAEGMPIPEWKSQILTFLKDNKSITPMQLAQTYNIPIKTAQSNITRLAKEGLIRKTGYGTYGLPEEK